ncbi:ricin-type beta-trefoil lectin domain-like protein [Catovirus CTV1]|uniref:Ricin-type beta-trefoil lectin domain-like protein n=1 Tax=Catovirus CTV1 TaxID=1977631 RepID=A0A1V0S930_9VIRU|nr:ricin-type beta-trefoil lectin domain-like protein [Catovirus CTV1]
MIILLLLVYLSSFVQSSVIPQVCVTENSLVFSYINTGNTTVNLDSQLYSNGQIIPYVLPQYFLPGHNRAIFSVNKFLLCDRKYDSIAEMDAIFDDNKFSLRVFPDSGVSGIVAYYYDRKNVYRSVVMKRKNDNLWYADNLNNNKLNYIDTIRITYTDNRYSIVKVNNSPQGLLYDISKTYVDLSSDKLSFRIIPDVGADNVYFNCAKSSGNVHYRLTSTSPTLWESNESVNHNECLNSNITMKIGGTTSSFNVNFMDRNKNICNRLHLKNDICDIDTWCNNLNGIYWIIDNESKSFKSIDHKFSTNCTFNQDKYTTYYTISSFWNGRIMDIKDGVLVRGTGLQLWDYVEGANQLWYVQYIQNNGTYYIKTALNHKCVTAFENTVRMEDCNNSDQQEFYINEIKKDVYEIESKIYAKCIDIKDWNPGNGAELQLWSCTKYENQLFKFIEYGHIII